MKVRLLLTLAAISFAVPALMAQDSMKAVKANEIVWQDDTTFKGLQFANLLGDPSKAELVVTRVKLPPNFKIPLHTHPWSEVITVLSGALGNASSDTDQGEDVRELHAKAKSRIVAELLARKRRRFPHGRSID